ncbi:hypothetical protein BX286_5749 [Streptomyces sp. 3211.6]|uniref:hypothetical protein n=1 Tax=Streptomyces TaxID=1883 RepID=UPI0009A52229|nr:MULTISPECIES: hypothetical protein [Streptomyces]RKT07682.1 hypothetical protein BX286_5749 [Streptomyces sp. 3211.6]RPF44690.1 hypothetical protein EDD96_1228 [Streptomyces sp. Ag109_G2-6]
MTPPTLPRQASSPEAGGGRPPTAEERRRTVRRRWITALIILLLVGVPAGYLAISAQQSRESGRDKAARVGAVKVRPDWPSKVQRSIYEVPIPLMAAHVGYLETNNWHTSRLYVQFQVSPEQLDTFLADVGTSRGALTPGVSVSERDAHVAGWSWSPRHQWSGITLEAPDPRPTRDVTVDFTNPKAPRVYVVSTTVP